MYSAYKPALALVLLSMTPVTLSASQEAEVGSTLNQKASVPISDVPAAVIAAVKDRKPDMTLEEAESETKGGMHYFDIEGTDALGNEIELDLVLEDGVWKVVEIQRDIDWKTVPKAVQSVLSAKVDGVMPDRIIESDQDNGMIIYEFYTQDMQGKEAKYEVSLKDGMAHFLTDEWKH